MVRRNDRTGRRQARPAGTQRNRPVGADARPARRTGADGVSVLPAAMVAALVAAGVAINRSVRKARSTPPRKAVVPARGAGGPEEARLRSVPQDRPSAPGGRTGVPGPGPSVPSGQVAVRPTVDDDGL